MTSNLAIFVDAGYLFKQGAEAAYGTALKRHEVSLDAKQFVDRLSAYAMDQFPDDELLRTYWYDGAKNGLPSAEQLSIAALRYVKFRRGRINSAGQQKGVDTLIVRDLMVLSQERSIQRAVVLSGDEDLREGIEYAQDRGVRVAVLGIDAVRGASQSQELVREADQVLTLPPEILQAALVRVVVAPEATNPTTSPSIVAGSGQQATVLSATVELASEFAREYAKAWISAASASEISTLKMQQPGLPRELDRELLKFVVGKSGVYPLDDAQCKAARRAFRAEIEAAGPTSK
ncbi:MAG: NYN domain-containing protein [Acidimicrobiaceae bacterium]|nr:NYN domain-containing protein [Acidimicrobiaceae bacterium]